MLRLPNLRPENQPVDIASALSNRPATVLYQRYETLHRDFALVQEQSVALHPGLNVITGESGAGKSVLMSAIGQILGAPAANGCVRPPAEMAVIEGTVMLGSGLAKVCLTRLPACFVLLACCAVLLLLASKLLLLDIHVKAPDPLHTCQSCDYADMAADMPV